MHSADAIGASSRKNELSGCCAKQQGRTGKKPDNRYENQYPEMGFRDAYAEFEKSNTVIFGISRDSLKSHDKFKANLGLPFELISDADELLCQQFDVIKQKMMYGKQVRGIERSTFVINTQGELVHEWRKVKVDNHVAEVLATVQTLSKSS